MFFHCSPPPAREPDNTFPLTSYCHVQLERASAWDLAKQLRALQGKDCLPAALTVPLPSAETSTMQLVDPSPADISCPLTSELPVIRQQNPIEQVTTEKSGRAIPAKYQQSRASIVAIY